MSPEGLTGPLPAPAPGLFRSWFQGGFECSTHRRRGDRRRIDVIAATGHDGHALSDYRQLAGLGLRTLRDGLRWHLIERWPGTFDWASVRPMMEAAAHADVEVIWDLMHYGWPDWLDIWQPSFIDRFARFAGAAARLHREATDTPPFFTPINEISFLAWGGGEVGYLNPFAEGRGFELKVHLVRASTAAMHAILDVDPRARFVNCDPLINVVHDPLRPQDAAVAEDRHRAQFQAWDMLSGRARPELGGSPRLLDIVGVNYYCHNQWIHPGAPIDIGHPLHRPFRTMLADIHVRYGRPILIAETGTEGDRRPAWLRYMANEARAAGASGVPLEGLCLYPILDHPGWDDDRDCPNGLLSGHPGEAGRGVHVPLAAELARQQGRIDEMSREGSPPLAVAAAASL